MGSYIGKERIEQKKIHIIYSGQFKIVKSIAEGETKIILGKTITVSDIQQKPEVTLLIDGVSGKLLETKNQEIINYMKISINIVLFKIFHYFYLFGRSKIPTTRDIMNGYPTTIF